MLDGYGQIEDRLHALAALEGFLREGGLDADCAAVLFFLDEVGRSSAGFISEALNIPKVKTSRCLKKLSALGLLGESVCKEDLRKCFFRLTDEGRRAVHEIGRQMGLDAAEGALRIHGHLKRLGFHIQGETGKRVGHTARIILLVLLCKCRPLSVSEICRAALLPQPRVSLALKALEENGLVVRQAQEGDLRLATFCLASGLVTQAYRETYIEAVILH